MERFSDHILKGSDVTEKFAGNFTYVDKDSGKIKSSCAVGAGMISFIFGCDLKNRLQSEDVERASEEFPYLYNPLGEQNEDLIPDDIKGFEGNFSFISSADASEEDWGRMKPALIIYELNDTMGWTRKAIAMWLRTVEDRVMEQQEQIEEEISVEENTNCLKDYTH